MGNSSICTCGKRLEITHVHVGRVGEHMYSGTADTGH